MKLPFYCPACGQESEIEHEFVLAPLTDLELACPQCGTEFSIAIAFSGVEA